MSDTTKNIEFKVKLNAEEANKQIADLQAKLREISKTSGYADRSKAVFGSDTQMNKESQAVFQKQQTEDAKYLRDKFNALQRNKKMQSDMLNESLSGIKQENEQLDRQKKLQADILHMTKQQIEIAEKAKSSGYDTSGYAGMQQQGGALALSGGGSGGNLLPPPDGMQGGASGAGGLGILQALGGAAVIRTIIQAVAGTANVVASGVYDYRQEKVRDQASIAKSLGQASGFNSVLSGRANELGYFASERNAGKIDAQEARKGMETHEGIDIAASGAKGALAGGMLGSIVPIIGTAIGAALGGLFGIGGSIMGSSTGAGIKSLIGEGSFSAGKERFKDKTFAQNYMADVEARKAKDPIKTAAYEYFESNRGKMLQAQQMSGMNDKSMLNTLGAGGGLYTESAKYGMMQGISGAGGSSAQMRRGVEGLDLQRGYGIQNSAGVMGMLSSGLGGGQTAGDSTTKRILADAFGMGLDASNFSRETEKFLQISAQVVSESGARDLEGQRRVQEIASGQLTGTSMKDIEAMGSGRDVAMSNLGAGGTQFEKALEFSKMRTNPILSKLSEEDRTYLADLSPDQIAAGSPILDTIAKEQGITPDQLRESLIGKGGSKEFRSTIGAKEAKAHETSQDLMGKYGKNISPQMFEEKLKNLPADAAGREDIEADRDAAASAQKTLAVSQYARGAGGGTDWRKLMSTVAAKEGFTTKGVEGDEAPKQVEGLAVAGDKSEAKSQQLSLELFKPFSDAYTQASKDVLHYSSDFVSALITMTAALKGQDKPKGFFEEYFPNISKNRDLTSGKDFMDNLGKSALKPK